VKQDHQINKNQRGKRRQDNSGTKRKDATSAIRDRASGVEEQRTAMGKKKKLFNKYHMNSKINSAGGTPGNWLTTTCLIKSEKKGTEGGTIERRGG